ncbi:MAG: addiction module toxin, HicA family [Proteobacteria bacterium]|nr:MAG: addiction module toxin, HicA family [Pseudomonadota bacterium]QKK11130.1 MAG: addiction module toxin, HicA family [Pseudomonadota bacterium]
MSFHQNIWNQLNNITAGELVKALEKDGWIREETRGAIQAFRKENDGHTIKRVTVHVHPKKTYGPKLLKELLVEIGWSESQLKKLKLIK